MMEDTLEVRPLEDMVAVGTAMPGRVRLWMRSSRPEAPLIRLMSDVPGHAAVEWRVARAPQPEADGTLAFWYPDNVPGAEPLLPGHHYRFELLTERAGRAHRVGAGRFATPHFRSRSARTRFAFASCNQPFDESGQLRSEPEAFATALEHTLDRLEADYLLLVGDQMYADLPAATSLFAKGNALAPGNREELDAQQIRTLYHGRYRRFWNNAFGRLQAHRPTYCMMDDHEIVDNFGSARAHHETSWRALREGALAAYMDYQGSRNLENRPAGGPFDYGFTWGNTATYVLDLRSERVPEDDGRGRMMSLRQFRAFETFLQRHADCAVIFIVCTVPPVFLPDWMIRGATTVFPDDNDAYDRWNAPAFHGDQLHLIELLQRQSRSNPSCRLVVLSGDIHEGGAVRVGSERTGFLQLVSSPVTNLNGGLVQWAAHKAGLLMSTITVGRQALPVQLIAGVDGAEQNPLTALNVGVVDVSANGGLRFRLLTADPERKTDLRTAFDSGEI